MSVRANYFDEDRFDRSKRIEWMDIGRIRNARCMVVGAGALGNEVVKNMVLSGFRNITLVDMDVVVRSNLNRCVFLREGDVGMPKAVMVAERATELYPDANIEPIVSKIQDTEDWNHDIVLGCVDNIQARLHLNANCVFHGIPYIDGATDGFRGKVQTVLDGTCLQCTMNRTHAAVEEKRFSCTGNESFVPRIAAEITTTSVIAAIQVREAVKLICGRMETCINGVMYYDGETGDMSILGADMDPECPNHR